ncbi:glycine betaine/proline transport system permease protein [Pelosinus fermentans]|jgi:glycine betaine/proline transport system permease protein|uniref:ABC-type transporter, integral membrane subunit n=2 Tax=Pelosinus TaxID=365348 RepID=I9ARW8_9FIRM|nr:MULTISPECIES: proline/glycine betaine ABC transporter permease [Pelosinus]EIW15692.1 ABC-type transporter, integral membrane subunit [Pelosinus fermentans B4]OAM92437.1 ABC-type transporter, integral membrane subunit [Pelosinus fermentans DSM 17108]SDQ44850.1 glycine betaine/proline transport system permease protein [Pelosinus fermentans]
MFTIPIGKYFETIIIWLRLHFDGFFNITRKALTSFINGFEDTLLFLPAGAVILLMAGIAWRAAGRGVAIFTVLSMGLIYSMGLWTQTMQTLALVLTSALIALVIGIPFGILAARNDKFDRIARIVLDFMQTMPAFVYLIPAVLFFKLGKVPGAVATVIFAMPPSVRLTNLGIRQVPEDVVEAARSFGSTTRQLLFKVQLPIAIPTILAGVNQTIMLSLSMVVIAAMIGAGGLGEEVLKGITQLKIGRGFESGVAVVLLAMVLDRITQSLANINRNRKM